MNRRQFAVAITGPAANDMTDIMDWSRANFGLSAAERYDVLLTQALIDLGEDPMRAGAQRRPDLLAEGVFTYHLASSRQRVRGVRVKEPRHLLLYRVTKSKVEIVRVLHERVDLERHLPKGYGSQDDFEE